MITIVQMSLQSWEELIIMAVKEDPEKRQKLMVLSSLSQGSQPSSLVSDRDSEAGMMEGKLSTWRYAPVGGF